MSIQLNIGDSSSGSGVIFIEKPWQADTLQPLRRL